jgi:hypothetical protein
MDVLGKLAAPDHRRSGRSHRDEIHRVAAKQRQSRMPAAVKSFSTATQTPSRSVLALLTSVGIPDDNFE